MEQKITLNRRFYPQTVIEEAAVAFNHLCSITVLDDVHTVKLESQTDLDPIVAREFQNYCLGLAKQTRKVE